MVEPNLNGGRDEPDSGSDVVSGDHSAGEMGSSERADSRRRSRLELVLEDDESEKVKVRLCSLPTHRPEKKEGSVRSTVSNE
jgi:hypothetical protein